MSKPASFCCAFPHPTHSPRIDSPCPPFRIPATIDGIFAAAALPENHPHALHFLDMSKKKAEGVDEGIVRSPSLANKIKANLGLRRRSTAGMRDEGQYDGDARCLSEGELGRKLDDGLGDAGRGTNRGLSTDNEGLDENALLLDVALPPLLPLVATERRDEIASDGRSSPLRNFEWLGPMLSKPFDGEAQSESEKTTDLRQVAICHSTAKAQAKDVMSTPKVPPSTSSLNMLDSEGPNVSDLRRTQSGFGLGSSMLAPDVRGRTTSFNSVVTQSSLKPVPIDNTVPTSNDRKASNVLGSLTVSRQNTTRSRASTGVHLHTMDISQQLRSMSQMSDPTETDSLLLPDQVWNFHQRERSDIGGLITLNINAAKESMQHARIRLHSPAPSSIYSRQDGTRDGDEGRPADFTTPLSNNNLGADSASWSWPLQPTEHSHIDGDRTDAGTRVDGLLSTTVRSIEETGAQSMMIAAKSSPEPSPGLKFDPGRADSLRSGSTTLTKKSAVQKFLRRSSSPPRRTVLKRRSIFRFLRPGSRKLMQSRSISSPVLRAGPCGAFDGPAEDSGTLAVQYELPELESQPGRSASMSQLELERRDSPLHLTVPANTPQRRPSLAEYERELTAKGDDRRRPSTSVMRSVQDFQDAGEDAGAQAHRKTSRAQPKEDEDTGLMAQALERAQQEKALFRSPSKQYSGSVLTPAPSAHREQSVESLASPTSPSTAPRVIKRRIGTSLSSWSRFPSHSRAERCASAGKADAIRTRDFAAHVDSEEVHGAADEAAAAGKTPEDKKSHLKDPSRRLPKSRSVTFDRLLSYYSNLFTTGGSTAANRRTSVATGGWLANPDLELLPPSPSSERAIPHHDHHFKEHLRQLEARMVQQLEVVEDEVVKVEEQAEELVGLHPHHHHTQGHKDKSEGAADDGGGTMTFRHGSIFRSDSGSLRRKRDSMWVGPMDSSGGDNADAVRKAEMTAVTKEEAPSVRSEQGLRLDGAPDHNPGLKRPASKADVWSALYQECLVRPDSSESKTSTDQQRAPPASMAQADGKIMPPPALEPVKPRSPKHFQTFDPKARVRRFPSVTVVDDRKGHARSVSLISAQVDRDGGIVRSSTNDLLKAMEAKEREERERLLAGF